MSQQRSSWWENVYGQEAPQPVRLHAISAITRADTSSFGHTSVFQSSSQPAPFTRMVHSPAHHLTPARTHQHLTTGPLQTSFATSPARPTQIQFEPFDPHQMSRKRKAPDSQPADGSLRRKRSRPSNPPSQPAQDTVLPNPPAEATPSKPTRLRIDRHVKAKVHEDMWMQILMHCPLKFLFVAEHINPAFRANLQKFQHLWKTCRLRTYGDDMPDPPNITEREYADLLDGRGCMNQNCAKADTVKTYWAFRARWCEECMKQRIFQEKHAKEALLPSEPLRLLECIPPALFAGGKYKGSKRPVGDGWNGVGHTQYLTEDVTRIRNEFKALVDSGASVEAQNEWLDTKSREMAELSVKIRAVEAWEKQRQLDAPKFRLDRRAFFVEKARNLNPPITEEVLEKMHSFSMSLDSNRAPNDIQWTKQLLPKILAEKSEAERLLRIQQDEQDFVHGFTPPEIALFRTLHSHRNGDNKPEQVFVLKLAQHCLSLMVGRGVADADLALIVLREFHRRYYEIPPLRRPEGVCLDGEKRTYELSFDDARMIMEKVVVPHIDAWNDITRIVAAKERFKCPACPRKDCVTRYSFVDVLGHINSKHSRTTGPYSRLRRAIPHPPDHVFPWFTVAWPYNLPILPDHYPLEKGYQWDPDDNTDYIEAPRSGNISAFEGRYPTNVENVAPEDFTGNLKFAAEKLLPTRLASDYQTKIALEFALRRYATVHGDKHPALEDIERGFKAVLLTPNRNVLNRLRCRRCVQDVHCPRTSKFVKSPQPFPDLFEHFKMKHFEVPWVRNMMHLPSDTELEDTINEDDKKLAQEKVDVTTKEAERMRVARKKPSKKADVILNTQSSLEVFRELFVEPESQIDPALMAGSGSGSARLGR